jgi:tripartite-type tricarboxylate transporter receptor subunit TctC
MNYLNLLTRNLFAACLLTSVLVLPGFAQTKPSYPVPLMTIINPMSSGGMTEVRMRTIGQFLQDEFDNLKVIVDTKAGGGSAVGIGYTLRQPADGSFLFGFTQPHASIAVVRGAPFKMSDIMPLVLIDSEDMALFVHKDSSYKTFADFYKDALKNPEKLTVAYLAGGADDLMAQYVNTKLGIKLRMIPYDGGAPSRQALAGKHVDLLVSPIYSAWREYPDDFRVLTIFSEERYTQKDFVDVLTIKEALKSVAPDFDVPKDITSYNNYNYVGVSKAFADKYPDRFDLLVKTIAKIFKDKNFIKVAGERNFYPKYGDPKSGLEISQQWDNIVNENSSLFK